MTHTTIEYIAAVRLEQKEFFKSGATLEVKFRKAMLTKLLAAIEKWEKPLADALWKDLHKSYEEAYLTEISIVKGEIRTHIKNVCKWAKRRKAPTPLKLFPSRSYIVKEPL